MKSSFFIEFPARLRELGFTTIEGGALEPSHTVLRLNNICPRFPFGTGQDRLILSMATAVDELFIIRQVAFFADVLKLPIDNWLQGETVTVGGKSVSVGGEVVFVGG